MRIILGFFALAAVATSAFAVGELRALRHHATVTAAPPAPEEEAVAPPPETPAPAVSQLSTWKGALPFGGVPTEPTNVEEEDRDSHDDIIDEEDRCPDTEDRDGDWDGCPDPEPVVSHRVIVREGRVITIDSSIIINGDIRLEPTNDKPEWIIY